MSDEGNLEVATLAGGCFWCLEAVYDELEGVVSVVPGYTGGRRPDPTYEQVCTGATGHAEAVQVTFDPRVISYRDILNIFFAIHDPTTLNRQGADVGTQYRSAIYCANDEQRREAEEVMASVASAGIYDAPIVTELAASADFYPAEQYHHDYFATNPNQPYCSAVVAPKVSKFRKQFMDRLKRTA